MDHAEMARRAAELIDQFDISCTGPDAPMWSLSGGNQQRVVMARELSHGPRVLVAAQPTRGLDVGAIEYLSRADPRRRRAAGSACCSSRPSSKRCSTCRTASSSSPNGRIVGEMVNDGVDLERLGMLMTGARDRVDDRSERHRADPAHDADRTRGDSTASTTIDEERPEVVAQARERSRRGVTPRSSGSTSLCVGVALALAAILVAATGGSWADVYTAMLDGSVPQARAGSVSPSASPRRSCSSRSAPSSAVAPAW